MVAAIERRVAGGPYDCANGDIAKALGDCLQGNPVRSIRSTTNSRASAGLVDPSVNLTRQKVHLFRGYNDGLIKQGMMDALYGYFNNYISSYNIMYKNNTKAGHTVPTVSAGNACDLTASPSIGNCNYDWAGSMLQYLYGQLNPRNGSTLSGQILEFAQRFHCRQSVAGRNVLERLVRVMMQVHAVESMLS